MKSVANPGNGSVAMSTARSRSVADAHTPSGVGDTRMPISPSFTTTISRCSSSIALDGDLAARDRRTPSGACRASMRSPMIARSAGTSSSTPSTRIVDVPAPSMCAPIAVRNAARSVISGSRAAFSMTVSPFASTAAVIRFSVAPTLGKSSTTPRAAQRVARARRRSRARPRARRPSPRARGKCMSSLRLPMLSPPGSATRASPHRASSGPSTLIDARIRLTSSYGASGTSGPARVDTQRVVALPLDARRRRRGAGRSSRRGRRPGACCER